MEKSEIAAYVLGGIAVALLTERAFTKFTERRKEDGLGSPQWTSTWKLSDRVPYNTKWADSSLQSNAEWANVYKDTDLKVGSRFSCYGPNQSKAIIVVTALYGPVAVINEAGRIRYDGNPSLGLLKHDGIHIFTNPVNAEWLGSILDPVSEIYGTSVNEGWEMLYSTIGELKDLKMASSKLEGNFNALATELAEQMKDNAGQLKTIEELRKALKMFNGEEEFHSYIDPTWKHQAQSYIASEVTFVEMDISSASVIVDMDGASEHTQVVETLEDIDMHFTDPEIVRLVEARFGNQ